ncbi:MAG: ABC transporter permease [Pseudomonadota bacterium]
MKVLMRKFRNGKKRKSANFELLPLRKTAPIVPPHSIAGRALVVVLGIMCFLACLTVAAVTLVVESASDWQRGISREATIQLRPLSNAPIEAEMSKAITLARTTPGILSVRALSQSENEELMKGWFGSSLDLAELPIPRMIELQVDQRRPPDLEALAFELRMKVKGASLDDHRQWRDRLALMTGSVVAIGVLILVLVLVAATLSVIFSTRAAMAANRDIVDVLNLVGAEDKFIARSFQRRFLQLGLEGGVCGGVAALIAFPLTNFLIRVFFGAAGEAQLDVLIGGAGLTIASVIAIIVTVLAIALISSVTSRFTVRHYLREHS